MKRILLSASLLALAASLPDTAFAQTCGITLHEEARATTPMSRQMRDRLQARQAALAALGDIPVEVKFALLLDRPPKIGLPASFSGRADQAAAMEAAAAAARDFQSALGQMHAATDTATLNAARNAALSAIDASAAAVSAFTMNIDRTALSQDQTAAAVSVQNTMSRNAHIADIVDAYATALGERL